MPVSYPCHDCKKNFPTPSKLAAHTNRKIPCTAGGFECRECNDRFTKRNARDRHQKRCTGRQETIDELKSERDALRAAVAQQMAPAQTTVIHNHNQVLNLTVNNIVLTAGKENLSHINRSLPALEAALNIPAHSSDAIVKWCEMIHCDPNCPQNHNVLLVDADAPKAWQYDGKWTEGETNKLLTALVGRDTQRLSGSINDADDLYSRPDLRAYKYDYLVHAVMSRCNSSDHGGLATILEPLKHSLASLTKQLYITEQQDAVIEDENLEHKARLLEIELARVRLQAEKQKLLSSIQTNTDLQSESRNNRVQRQRLFEVEAELIKLQIAEEDANTEIE